MDEMGKLPPGLKVLAVLHSYHEDMVLLEEMRIQ